MERFVGVSNGMLLTYNEDSGNIVLYDIDAKMLFGSFEFRDDVNQFLGGFFYLNWPFLVGVKQDYSSLVVYDTGLNKRTEFPLDIEISGSVAGWTFVPLNKGFHIFILAGYPYSVTKKQVVCDPSDYIPMDENAPLYAEFNSYQLVETLSGGAVITYDGTDISVKNFKLDTGFLHFSTKALAPLVSSTLIDNQYLFLNLGSVGMCKVLAGVYDLLTDRFYLRPYYLSEIPIMGALQDGELTELFSTWNDPQDIDTACLDGYLVCYYKRRNVLVYFNLQNSCCRGVALPSNLHLTLKPCSTYIPNAFAESAINFVYHLPYRWDYVLLGKDSYIWEILGNKVSIVLNKTQRVGVIAKANANVLTFTSKVLQGNGAFRSISGELKVIG